MCRIVIVEAVRLRRPLAAPVQQKTALIVACGSDIDQLPSNVLDSEGWSTHRAVDNQQARALATAEPFDLIVPRRTVLCPDDVELKVSGTQPVTKCLQVFAHSTKLGYFQPCIDVGLIKVGL